MSHFEGREEGAVSSLGKVAVVVEGWWDWRWLLRGRWGGHELDLLHVRLEV